MKDFVLKNGKQKTILSVFSISTLFILIIIAGCLPEEEISRNQSAAEEKPPESLPLGDCPGKFICISSRVSAYQDRDCKIANRTTCEEGCADGVCETAGERICTPGFKCKNQYERGFQRESCVWDKREKCQYGCDQQTNKCHTASLVNVSTASSVNPDKEPRIGSYPTLVFGEKVMIGEEELSIYIIEPEQVKLQLGSRRSDWLGEEDSHTYGSGVTITVKEILFQPFAGGKKQVAYSIG